jgi:hypothetical protein
VVLVFKPPIHPPSSRYPRSYTSLLAKSAKTPRVFAQSIQAFQPAHVLARSNPSNPSPPALSWPGRSPSGPNRPQSPETPRPARKLPSWHACRASRLAPAPYKADVTARTPPPAPVPRRLATPRATATHLSRPSPIHRLHHSSGQTSITSRIPSPSRTSSAVSRPQESAGTAPPPSTAAGRPGLPPTSCYRPCPSVVSPSPCSPSPALSFLPPNRARRRPRPSETPPAEAPCCSIYLACV